MSISDDLITFVLFVVAVTSIVIAVRNRRIQKRNEREAKAARDRENAIRLELPVIEAASPEVVGGWRAGRSWRSSRATRAPPP